MRNISGGHVARKRNLSTCEEGTHGPKDFWTNGIQIAFTKQTKRNPVSEFGIDSSKPSLHDSRRVMFIESACNLERKAESRLNVTVGLIPFYPAIHRPEVFDIGLSRTPNYLCAT
jgi:hypothetical protein